MRKYGKKKPNTVLTYNSKKVGVDSVDQMSRQYFVKAPTRRWPVCVFYNKLNMTIIKSWVIYRRINGSDISRRNLIIKIIEEIFDHVSERRSKTMASPLQKLSINTPSPSTKRKSQFQPFASSAKRLFDDQNEQTRAACQIRLCNNNKTAEK
jgi:hypothetical protein